MSELEEQHMAWWKESVVYQIYPRSFLDTNGDGIGDLRGIMLKLDYLQTLGIDVIWLCPIYPSSQFDGGYDISDYRNIANEFGTLKDWQALVGDMHARGMKLVMDLVVNHTSDQHPWFVASKKSKDNPYRNYYIWREGKNGGEPSNWGSHFGGSAWKFDAQTGEHYLHLFSEHQPDLNWDNPAVRQEIFAMMRFWLALGVDGFRLDTVNMFSKNSSFPDVASRNVKDFPVASEHFLNGPNLLEYLQEMKTQVLADHDVMTVGEAPEVTPTQAIALTHQTHGALSMVFGFEHMQIDSDPNATMPKWTQVPWSLEQFKQITNRWQQAMHNQGWNSIFLSSHDEPRLVSRFGDDGIHRVASAKLLATYLLTLQGTPYIFQGDEIGMTNVQFESIEEYRDIDSLNLYRQEVLERGRYANEVLKMIHTKGRDNARTPMQWDASSSAGFTTGQPWIGVNPNHTQINVEQSLDDPNSIFWHYQKLIQLRRSHGVFVHGRFDLLQPEHPSIFAYTRTYMLEQATILLNFCAHESIFDFIPEPSSKLLLSNLPVPEISTGTVTLQPFEARVYLSTKGGDAMV
jgi:oligo-1,6-glucosidase